MPPRIPANRPAFDRRERPGPGGRPGHLVRGVNGLEPFRLALHMVTPTRYRPFRNWSGSQACVPAYTVRAETEQDVLDAVRLAIRDGLSVRPMGSGLSFSAVCQTGGLLLDQAGLSGITGIDAARGRARVLAGTKVWRLCELLWEAGWSLMQQGALDAQSIVGAFSTGTHGTGTQLACMASNVRWVRLVDGSGEIVEIGEDEPDRLHAAQVSLGTLGVITEVELEVVPRYHLAEDIRWASWDESMSHWDESREHRHYAAMWFPHHHSPELYAVPPPEGMAMADKVMEQRFNPVELVDESAIVEEFGSRRHRAYTILSLGGGVMPPLYEEMEYMVPAERAQEAAGAVRTLFRERHPEHAHPVYLRFIKGDPALLSPFHERDSVSFSIGYAPESDHWTLFTDVDRLLLDGFAARPHWGKNHLLTRERMVNAYPRLDDFVRIRRELDPQGVFLSDHLRPLVG
jgi:FAD/FMN-containing dehydrogenase